MKEYLIYCGSEDYAEFLINTIGLINLKAEHEVVIIDGEYHLKLKL